MTVVKFCGMTRREDIEYAVGLGVDYVGVVLYDKSPRFVEWKSACKLLEGLEGVRKVAVMVNPTLEEVDRVFEVGFDLVQLHGSESSEFAKLVGTERTVKAFQTCPGLEVPEVWKNCHSILLDACTLEGYGGSGKVANWTMASDLTLKGYRVILAGGLNPQNVMQAIKAVRPYGVDVSSGIESSPGIKDRKKMEEFINAVKYASGN